MGFVKRVQNVVKVSDIIIEILDARFADETRNKKLEENVYRNRKKLLFVVNKSDLVRKKAAEDIKKRLSKFAPCVFVSATEKIGVRKLREAIGKLASDKNVKIGIVGYPNTGKSSIINMLKGKKAAKSSSVAGFTKGEQYVRISENILLVDTPGVIPFGEKNEDKLAVLSARTSGQVKDLESAATAIISFIKKKNLKALEDTYNITVEGDDDEILEKIAFARKKLRKGGLADVNAAARLLMNDWQRGKIKI